ncbi:MAG TPA: hypothetical protein VMT17_08275 [Anaeromyxobacteraceae bacterium]|nr:hypothetical protein [Anaeromyxobacteraceae bacterium]
MDTGHHKAVARLTLGAAALLLAVAAPDLGIALGARLMFHLAGWDGGSEEQVKQAERRLAAIEAERATLEERARRGPADLAVNERRARLGDEQDRAKRVLERLRGEPPPAWAKRALRVALVVGPTPFVLYILYGLAASVRRRARAPAARG